MDCNYYYENNYDKKEKCSGRRELRDGLTWVESEKQILQVSMMESIVGGRGGGVAHSCSPLPSSLSHMSRLFHINSTRRDDPLPHNHSPSGACFNAYFIPVKM